MRRGRFERDFIKAMGYSFLLALGLTAAFVLYWSLMTSAQVLAVSSGGSSAEVTGIGLWATGTILFLGSAPMLRFLVAELPNRVGEAVALSKVRARWLGAFALGLLVLVAL